MMDSKFEIKGDVDVAIGQNHAPITINYGGSGGGDEPPSGFVYFSEMTLEQLNHCKFVAEQSLSKVRKEIFYSAPALSIAIHFVGVLLIFLNIVEFIGVVKQLKEYTLLMPLPLVFTLHFLRKKIERYAPLIGEYKAQIAGIENELLRRRISSR